MPRLPAALLAASVLLLSGSPAAADTAGPGGGALTPGAVDDYLEDYLASSPLPGAAVAVTRGAEVVHVAGYGTDSGGRPVTADTPMGVASVSKAFTALAVMQLVEEGEIGLDDRVADRLPGFALADPRGAEITVRQLLTHTSGMSDTSFREKSEPAPDDLSGAVARLAGAGLAAEPGTEVNYHNPNYHVAARLVEVVGGLPFGEFLEQRTFAPLGMDDTVTVDTVGEVFGAGVARGHVGVLGNAVPAVEPASYVNGAGGMVTTAADMARWLVAQNGGGRGADGARILSEEGVAATHAPLGGGGGGERKGLGWDVGETPAGAPMLSHGGIQFTYTAHQALLPESGHGIAVMANTGLGGADASALLHGLVALAEGDEPAPPAGPVLLAVDAVLAGLAVSACLLAVRGVRGAGRWAAAARGRARWRTALRLLPGLAVVCAAVVPHRLVALLAQGRDLTWLQSLYTAPTAVTLLVTAALAFAAVYAARAVALARPRRTLSPEPA
ncbi:serine hydrolase domain-containing protein [Nocardiopsis sp. NPDC101807]|uniref:serine hydrolase domain-containing protein n=1 Tax=Nocardiopsis sp. NPDC101807 TaxID=3364339 RepID=UPI003821D2A8